MAASFPKPLLTCDAKRRGVQCVNNYVLFFWEGRLRYMTTGVVDVQELSTRYGMEVKTEVIDRVAHASDASHYLYTPKAVIEARSAEHVAAIFRAGRQQNVPVTLRSGGTSLAGQASGDGYLVDVRKHFRGIEVLDEGKRVCVQPGATVRQVNARLGPVSYTHLTLPTKRIV